jgi:hypothetical protein
MCARMCIGIVCKDVHRDCAQGRGDCVQGRGDCAQGCA